MLRCLFISRAHPPIIGGLENHNYWVAHYLAQKTDYHGIINRRGKKFLPLFMPWALLKALLLRKKIDVILLGDGFLAILAPILKGIIKTPIICTVHGLDITYDRAWYQRFWVKKAFHSIDHFIAVSSNTAASLQNKGIEPARISIIFNGINLPKPLPDLAADHPMRQINPTAFKLFHIGRFVKRKGMVWFIEQVMPQLPSEIILIIAGYGPEYEAIQQAIARQGLDGRVFVFLKISDLEKHFLFQQADLFIQPNIRVPHDIEGFGLTVLEANAYGVPVLASKVDGLVDAVADGITGRLLEEKNAEQYIHAILEFYQYPDLLAQYRQQARQHIEQYCLWSQVVDDYIQLMQSFKKDNKP